jgi:subtilisin family serine protease
MARGLGRTFVALTMLLALTSAGAASAAGQRHATLPHASRPSSVPGQLIVSFRGGVPKTGRAAALGRAGASTIRTLGSPSLMLVSVRPRVEGRALGLLRGDSRVRYAEPNATVSIDAAKPNDSLFGKQWGLNNTGQQVDFSFGTRGADIGALRAWGVTTGSSAVTVAVIDTGIDTGHPDLAPNIWINPGENCAGCRTDGIDNDGNGYVDDWRGWDFINNDNNPFDDNGHGTHVAGTIGAVGNNKIGVAGVSWTVRLMPLKFIGADGTGDVADAVRALHYATAMGAQVSNNSWGGDEYSQALSDAIAEADAHGSLFVAAAGNESSDNDASPQYPSGYDLPNVISVAASDSNDQLAYFSNHGRATVDLAAPGQSIYSTWPGNGYRSLSGTSMAAPHVTGTVALALAAHPGAGDAALKALLLRTVAHPAGLAGQTATGGRPGIRGRRRAAVAGAAAGGRVRGCVRRDGDGVGKRSADRARRPRRWSLHRHLHTGRLRPGHDHCSRDRGGRIRFGLRDRIRTPLDRGRRPGGDRDLVGGGERLAGVRRHARRSGLRADPLRHHPQQHRHREDS